MSLISKSSFLIGKISFGLLSITDIFYAPLNFIFVIRTCMTVMCPSISTCTSPLLHFMSFEKDIYTESIKPFTHVDFSLFCAS